MLSELKKILLVTKQNHPDAALLAKEISQWLEENHFNVHILANSKLMSNSAQHKDVDLVIVLGGDGTLLYVARSLLTRKVPFLGINFGKVGFLAEISPHEWKDILPEILIHQKLIQYIVSTQIHSRYTLMKMYKHPRQKIFK